MTTFHVEPGAELYQGHAVEVLAGMPEGSIDCVVLSPPFFGLRKYSGNQELIWGARDGCVHEWGKTLVAKQAGGTDNAFADKKN